MSYEPVHTRPDIYVTLRVRRVDHLSHQEILVKVMAHGSSTRVVSVKQDGVRISNNKQPVRNHAGLFHECATISKIGREPTYAGPDPVRVDATLSKGATDLNNSPMSHNAHRVQWMIG